MQPILVGVDGSPFAGDALARAYGPLRVPWADSLPLGLNGRNNTRLWSPEWDSNPRPTHYECVALPLSYPGAAVMLSGRSFIGTEEVVMFTG